MEAHLIFRPEEYPTLRVTPRGPFAPHVPAATDVVPRTTVVGLSAAGLRAHSVQRSGRSSKKRTKFIGQSTALAWITTDEGVGDEPRLTKPEVKEFPSRI